jgi:hypothetical protein
MRSINLRELARCSIRGDLHDCRPGALKVGLRVKVANQQVSLDQVSYRVRHHKDAVWVYVAIRRHGRRHDCDGVEGRRQLSRGKLRNATNAQN